MYLLTEIILFIPLVAYSCLQVRRLIPRPGLKRMFVLLSVALFLAYPVAETISHHETGAWAACAILCGYYCLPYLLYMTFSVLAIDIAILLARSIKLLRPETVSSRGFRSGRLGCYLLVPALTVAAGAWHNDRLLIKNLSVDLPQKSSELSNFFSLPGKAWRGYPKQS